MGQGHREQGAGAGMQGVACGRDGGRRVLGQDLEPGPRVRPVSDAFGVGAEAVVMEEVGPAAQDKAHFAIVLVRTTTPTEKPSETAYNTSAPRTARQPQSQALQSWKSSDSGLCA